MAKLDWQTLLVHHGRWLRTVVYARVGQSEAVEEVLQEVALAAVRQSAPVADPSKVAPWLYRLAVRQALLYRRRCGRRRKLADRYAGQAAPLETSDYDPLLWLLARERRQLVRVALEQLPHRDRELLLLKYTEDWSYRQIADHLGITSSAVEARLHRARARLRAQLTRMQLSEARP